MEKYYQVLVFDGRDLLARLDFRSKADAELYVQIRVSIQQQHERLGAFTFWEDLNYEVITMDFWDVNTFETMRQELAALVAHPEGVALKQGTSFYS